MIYLKRVVAGNKQGLLRGVLLSRREYLLSLLLVLLIIGLRGAPNSHVQSLILDVPYYDQQESSYCGPATIMMVLDYTGRLDISQTGLSYELSTDTENGVTYTSLMDEPFIHRELTNIRDGRMTLNQLKKQIMLGYAPILLIWFDDSHETGHYVVVVGYNETGVFINDPWPTQWGKPVGRETGSFVYLSNEKLLDLWSIHRNWAITAAYTPSPEKLHKIDVVVAGLPNYVKTRLSLNGEHLDVLELGETTSLILNSEPHVLSVETVLYDEDGVGYYCTNNLQRVTESQTIQFAYTLLDR